MNVGHLVISLGALNIEHFDFLSTLAYYSSSCLRPVILNGFEITQTFSLFVLMRRAELGFSYEFGSIAVFYVVLYDRVLYNEKACMAR